MTPGWPNLAHNGRVSATSSPRARRSLTACVLALGVAGGGLAAPSAYGATAVDTPAITLTANHVSVTYGHPVTLSGVLTDNGAPLASNQIQLSEKGANGVEEPIGTLTSDATGAFSSVVTPYFNGTFYVRYAAASASIPSHVSVAAHHISASVKKHAVTVVAQFLPGVAFKGTLRVPLTQEVSDKFGNTKTVKTSLVIGPRHAAKGLVFGYGTATLKLTLPVGAYTVSLQVPATSANDAGPVQKIYFKVK